MELFPGIVVGILLSMLAVQVGKKYSREINQDYVSNEPAQIIKRRELIDEIAK